FPTPCAPDGGVRRDALARSQRVRCRRKEEAMRITHTGEAARRSPELRKQLTRPVEAIWKASLFATLGLYAYLIYGLCSGQMSATTREPFVEAHLLQLTGALSFWLNISLLVTLVSAIVLYFEEKALGCLLVGLSLFFGCVLPYGLDLFLTARGGSLATG